jgi:glycosyltransferase involved in cell wall biosynthesis
LIAEALSIRDRVVFTGWVDERDKAVLYSKCLGFVFPSEYEGFGLPPLEALSCGAPVITSDVSSLPEVVGDAAITVSPSDVDGLAQAMLSLVSDPVLRERLMTSGLAQARSFSWIRTAEGTLAGFREAIRAPE